MIYKLYHLGALINERLRQASDVGDTESLEMKVSVTLQFYYEFIGIF